MPHGGMSFAQPADLSAVSNQNKMKLRVNRVAILQELRAEHVVGHLARHSVLSPAEMRLVCTETDNPVAVLLDILIHKENRTQWYNHFLTALRKADVDLEQKRRYRRLIDFLENTIIRFPAKQATSRYPRYDPLPGIQHRQSVTPEDSEMRETASMAVVPVKARSSGTDSPRTPHGEGTASSPRTDPADQGRTDPADQDRTDPADQDRTDPADQDRTDPADQDRTDPADLSTHHQEATHSHAVVVKADKPTSMTLISGHYHQWVPSLTNHKSRLPDPTQILISLETADDKVFHEQIKAEKLALHRMQELEMVYIMHRQKRLPKGFVLCMADCVSQIVDDIENHHLYVKYFMTLEQNYNLRVVKELVGSFANWLMATKLGDIQKNVDLLQKATKFALNLFDLLDELGDYVNAEAVVSVLTVWLMVQPCLETWMHGYTACVRLSMIRIRNFQFSQADKSLNSAIQYLNAIKLMSFGQKLVDESEKMVATSWLMYELGSHDAAYHWAHDGLKEVNVENKRGVVNALCNGVRCFAATYNLQRAHQLAIEAVKQAGAYFDKNHPMFIKARLTYIEFANEFCTVNERVLKIATDTLKRCELIYHCDSMLLARAYMALSNAYINAAKLADDTYLSHARKAQRIAMNCVHGMHPILSVFSEQIAKCSLIKSRVVPKPVPEPDTLAAMKMTQLIYAASELSVAYRIYCPCFGTHSFRAATAQVMLADIMDEEGNYLDAQELYEDALGTFEVCLRTNNPHYTKLTAKMARFYYRRGELQRALRLIDTLLESFIKDGKLETGPIRVQWMEAMFEIYLKAIADLNDPDRLQSAQQLRETWRQETHYLQPVSLSELAKPSAPFTHFQNTFSLWKRVTAKKVTSLATETSDGAGATPSQGPAQS